MPRRISFVLKILTGLFVLLVLVVPATSGSTTSGRATTWRATALKRPHVKKPAHPAKKPAHRAKPPCKAPAVRRRRPKHRPAPKPVCKHPRKPARKPTSHPAGKSPAQSGGSAPAPGAACCGTSTPPASTPSGVAGSPPASQTPASAWDRPALVNPTTVTIGPSNYNLMLDQSKDYVLRCPPGPVELPSTLSVWGGHDVVLEDCDLQVTQNWVAYLHNQTGTMWVHDVHFGGTDLGGGVQLQEPGATVVMRDVLFDEVYGSYTTNHAELIQTWSGPNRLLIDGLSGVTNYQGLYLLPNQDYSGPAPALWDLRNIDIDNSQGGYALWLSDQDGAFPVKVQNVWIVPNPAKTWRGWWLWGFGGQDSNSPGDGTWANVSAGTPPGGSYVHASSNGARGVDESVSPTALAGEQP